jgi:cytochrome c peroxidase
MELLMRQSCPAPASRLRADLCAVFFFAAISTSAVAAEFASAPLTPAKLGRETFRDPSVSASGRMSCATCHDPAHAQSNASAAQSGGANLDVPGFRSVPSLRYLNSEAFLFDKDGTPTAGFNHDGRTASLLDQAERPLLAPHEMADGDAAAVAAKLRTATYAEDFLKVFGDDAFDDADGALLRARFAIAAYEKSAPELHPFDSKYDYFLRGKVMLAPVEPQSPVEFSMVSSGAVECDELHQHQFTGAIEDDAGSARGTEIDM